MAKRLGVGVTVATKIQIDPWACYVILVLVRAVYKLNKWRNTVKM